MVSLDVEAASAAMGLALADARLEPLAIDYLNANGTGTVCNDRNETAAIKRVFGRHAYKLGVSSTKSMHGHPFGAAGGIEAIACVKAMEAGWMPPTIGLSEKDPVCDLDYVPNVGRERNLTYTMSNNFALGGLNAVLIFRLALVLSAAKPARSNLMMEYFRHHSLLLELTMNERGSPPPRFGFPRCAACPGLRATPASSAT